MDEEAVELNNQILKAKNAFDTDSEDEDIVEDKVDQDQFDDVMDEFLYGWKDKYGNDLLWLLGEEEKLKITDEHRQLKKEGIFGK